MDVHCRSLLSRCRREYGYLLQGLDFLCYVAVFVCAPRIYVLTTYSIRTYAYALAFVSESVFVATSQSCHVYTSYAANAMQDVNERDGLFEKIESPRYASFVRSKGSSLKHTLDSQQLGFKPL